MTSVEAKSYLLNYLLYKMRHHCAVTEYGREGLVGNADVFSLTNADYSNEFEIKVNRGDLLSELNTIRYIKNPPAVYDPQEDPIRQRTPSTNKLGKHSLYLSNLGLLDIVSVPNKFYFAVPKELVELAIQRTQGTPYGVVKISDKWFEVNIEKPAEYLHKKKVEERIKRFLLRKTSVENANLREKLLKTLSPH